MEIAIRKGEIIIMKVNKKKEVIIKKEVRLENEIIICELSLEWSKDKYMTRISL